MFSNVRLLLLTGVVLLGSALSHICRAQALSADDFFLQARKESFENKNYSQAINLCNQALSIQPAYYDIAVFKGNLYSWMEQTDSARQVFQSVLAEQPSNKDALLAIALLEYRKNHLPEALDYCNAGLQYYNHSNEFLLLKARTLSAQGKYKDAMAVNSEVLQSDSLNKDARALDNTLKDQSASNRIDVNYQYSYFDTKNKDPWHLGSIGYMRRLKSGSVNGTLNFANRFNNNGLQLELESYQHLSKRFYTYVEGAYALTDKVFPKYRGSFSLFANLPKSFEAEAGLRYLKFDGSTFIYALGVGKYWKSYWFNVKSYLTPENKTLTQSYSFTGRYYYKTANDYVSLSVGRGISPDDKSNNLQLRTEPYSSSWVNTGYKHALNNFQVFYISTGWIKQEYVPKVYGNQFDFNIGFQQRF